MPLILGTNSIKDTGYDVDNSLRFNDGSSDYLNKTLGTASNRKIFTVSYWIKKTTTGLHTPIVEVASSGGSIGGGENAAYIAFNTSDKLNWFETHGGGVINLTTNRVFRDLGAWYHIMYAVDTTQGTSTNRIKLYVNGVQETSFESGASTYPSENLESYINSNQDATYIGRSRYSNKYFDGYMCEVVHVDGTAQSPTDLGEFDSDSGIWKPIDVSGLTFGTNGFYLDFEDSSALGNDAAGSNNFTVNNLTAVDQSTDTCTNNFATLNPLFPNSGLTFSEGNLNVVASDANYRHAVSSMAVDSGKWYAEFKAVSGFDSTDKSVGIYRTDNTYSATTGLGNYSTGTTWSYGATGNVRTSAGNNDTGEATFTNGDIIAVAMDLDNNKLYFAKNNAWINSGDPTSGSTGTGSYAIVAGDFYHFAATSISSGGAALWSCNFGSPAYAISSGNTDGNGYGNFEYAVPSGYFSLCTKNLAEYG